MTTLHFYFSIPFFFNRRLFNNIETYFWIGRKTHILFPKSGTGVADLHAACGSISQGIMHNEIFYFSWASSWKRTICSKIVLGYFRFENAVLLSPPNIKLRYLGTLCIYIGTNVSKVPKTKSKSSVLWELCTLYNITCRQLRLLKICLKTKTSVSLNCSLPTWSL